VNKVTSGRGDLIVGGLELLGNRPLWGYGSGSFGRAFRQERKGNQEEAVSASHTMPITIGAEQGVIGLAVYAAVLIAGFRVLFGNAAAGAPRPPPDGRAPGSPRPPPGDEGPRGSLVPVRAAVAAMFCALVVHTMAYAAFLEDPFTWVILATGIALAPFATLAKATVRAAPAPSEPVPAPTS
jgi:O-antigen ligase